MRPYYQHAGITIFLGDCRELLPQVDRSDLLCTDPPYGIGADKRKAHSSIRDNPRWDDACWDTLPPRWILDAAIELTHWQVIWGGNYFDLPPSRCWLVWNKMQREFSLADAELAWTNFDAAVRIFDYPRMNGNGVHPTQKPLPLIKWAMGRAPEWESVVDPFAGSGTTLVAAKDLGRRAIGIEIEEKYCEIAAKRLSQEVLEFT